MTCLCPVLDPSAVGRVALACALALALGCEGATTPEEVCGNGLDDDQDLVTDCDDIDCVGHPTCAHGADGDADTDADLDEDGDDGADAEADHDVDPDPDVVTDGDEAAGGLECDPDRGSATWSTIRDAATACDPREQPLWAQLYWGAETPSGTEMELAVRTAETATELESATLVEVATTPPDSSPADIQSALSAASVPNGLRFLEAVATLRCPEGATGARLDEITVLYYCE